MDVSAGDMEGVPFALSDEQGGGSPPGRQPHAVREAQAVRDPRAVLRRRWRTASLACGWRFPDDWDVAEVDLVCSAVVRSGGLDGAGAALVALAHARAAAGTGLEETLGDLAALHAVLQVPAGEASHADALDAIAEAADADALPTRLLRITAVAWAEVALNHVGATEVHDSLTGLPTQAYLRTRLSELYRQAARDGVSVAGRQVLVVISLGFDDTAVYLRPAGMILAADVLRQVFDGGESHAVLGASTVVAVVARSDDVAHRAVRLRRELTERFAVDPQLVESGSARVNVVRLPATHDDACVLLESLAAR
ncbi:MULTISPECIES: GGDEF domain-containing protein [Prauserella salsuginis group]|uniref:GGDEF domain-containing protein n=2 Tax=Prauserella salsuginis group TaxID=2893672 RepID=A0A839XD97_9PSEU|nr:MULTISPECIES: GGDEF domain-containing protein [Prauserella salsuginis group]MBB3661922.1 GGDEF domain-containing protein [Prauserella sediminis]MCR3722702.1 hypothetical protein [Prauserella flava]MCR3737243.1 hypothetical protein [Prauserella salsuginis]